jgi:arylsulfatase A-like enzyme
MSVRQGAGRGRRAGRRGRIGALALLAVFAGCGERPHDLVLISIDTLRADRLGSYGRQGAGTPHLDRLARSGARFSDAMAPAPITLPSHASLFTGLDPSRHGVRHNGLYALDERAQTLAERLRDAGFRTGAFVASVALAARHGLDQGFERYTEPGGDQSRGLFFLAERPAQQVNRDALAWLDELATSERVFLFVHYMEPHAPFEPPEPELSRFAGDRYQAEIAASDRALGELLAHLAARGRLRHALVAVVGDHGESLGEHGELSHGIFVYQSTLHVPLILAGPGVPPSRVVDEPVSLIDLMPTLLAAAGLEEDQDGRSLWPALRGESLGPRALYGESFAPRLDFGWSELRVWRRGAEKWTTSSSAIPRSGSIWPRASPCGPGSWPPSSRRTWPGARTRRVGSSCRRGRGRRSRRSAISPAPTREARPGVARTRRTRSPSRSHSSTLPGWDSAVASRKP